MMIGMVLTFRIALIISMPLISGGIRSTRTK